MWRRGRGKKYFSGVLTAGAIRVECIIRRPLVVVDDECVGGLLFDNLVASAKRIPFCLVPGLLKSGREAPLTWGCLFAGKLSRSFTRRGCNCLWAAAALDKRTIN